MIRKLGGWGGGGATRCEGVRAALSPTETLGWHMGTMPPWGQSDGEGSTTLSPPSLRHPPPPRAALSRLRQCPQPGPVSPSAATRGWGNGGGGRGGIRSPCRTGSRAPSTLQREQWLRVTLTPHRRPHGTCQPHRAVGPQPARGHGANPHPDRGTEGPQAVPSPLHAGGFGVDGGWGGGGSWGALPPPRGAPGCCCTLEGLHSHSGENESARKVSAAPGPSPHGALRPLGAGKGPRRPPTHPSPKPTRVSHRVGTAVGWGLSSPSAQQHPLE